MRREIFKVYCSNVIDVLQVVNENFLLFNVRSETYSDSWYDISLSVHYCNYSKRISTYKYIMCRKPRHEECSQHYRHMGDPGVTYGTCGAIGKRAKVILR
jgi:hypothetical protein